jgi:hypothetical protein
MEINPEHPVTQEMHDMWHKMCGVLLWKFANGAYTVTMEDMNGFMKAHPDCAVIFHAHRETVDLKIVTMEEGLRLAEEERNQGGAKSFDS